MLIITSDLYLVVSLLDPQEGSCSAVKDAKVPWSDEETLHLLDIWGKDSVQRALKGCLKNRHIFTQIAQKMAERGYMRSVEQCQTRIKRLKKYFRQNHKWVKRTTCPLAVRLRFPEFFSFAVLVLFLESDIRANSKMEYRFHEQLQRVLGSSRLSNANEITYDAEELNDDEESRDGDEDPQVLGHTVHRDVGMLASRTALLNRPFSFFAMQNNHPSDADRDSEHSLDRLGDAVPHQHVGGGHAAAGAEDDAQNRTYLHHHIQQDGRPGLLQDAGAVPDTAEEAQAELQAELPQQVCLWQEAGAAIQGAGG